MQDQPDHQDYLRFWGLTAPVFARALPAERVFAPPRFVQSLERLALACAQSQPIVVLSGEAGAGKSTALRWLFRRLDATRYDVLLTTMVQREREAGWLAPRLAALMGLDGASDGGALLRAIAGRLDELIQEGRRLIVVVDAAHCAETPAALDEIVALLNIQALAGEGASGCIAFVLCGTEGLLDTLEATPELAARIAFHAHLSRLTREEAAAYLRWRLAAAGVNEAIFDDDALDFLHMKARGVFAALDTCADACLVEAFQRGVRRVTADVAKAATDYLGTRELTTAQRRRVRMLTPEDEIPSVPAPTLGHNGRTERPIKLSELTRSETDMKKALAKVLLTPQSEPDRYEERQEQESASIKLSSLFKS